MLGNAATEVLTFSVRAPKMQETYDLPSHCTQMAASDLRGPRWANTRNRDSAERN
jgi:hypothetical protein